MNIRTRLVLLVFLIASTNDFARGQTFWQAGTDDWFIAANWTLGVPNNLGDAVIANGGTAQVFTPGGSVHRLRVGRVEGPGSLLIDGGALTVTDDLHVNEGSAGPASVAVRGGGTVTAPDTVVGFSNAADASFLISGAGTVYNSTTSFTVARAGTGAAFLTIDEGAVLTSGTSSMGTFSGSNGIVELKGAGSRWSNTGDFVVGNSGYAELRVSDGGELSNNVGIIGLGIGSNGFVTIDGAGSQWINNSVLAVGIFGAGGMNISGGAQVLNTSARIGREPGGTGAVSVSGQDSDWYVNGDLTVGGAVGGVGALTIEDQATVYVENNFSINSLSNVYLSGGTLRLNTASGLNRLSYVSGTIQLSGERTIGGDPIISALFGTGSFPNSIGVGKGLVLEDFARVAGQLNVDGGNLRTSNLLVGYQDFQVKMRITNGGTVHSGFSSLGGGDFVQPIGQGDVLVSGAGSTWNAENIGVGSTVPTGQEGDTILSTLTIEDQGLVYIEGTLGKLNIYPQGIVNLNGGTLRLKNFDLHVRPGHRAGQFNFNAGTIQFAGDRIIGDDETVTEMLGAAPTLTAGKGMTVEGVATLKTSVIIDGGTFSAGQLVNGQNVALQRGTLNITNQAITIGTGGPLGDALDIDDDMTVNVTLGVTNQGLVTGDGQIGGTFNNAADGELRADPGKSLVLIGAGNANNGQIQLLGGSLDFRGDLTNSAGAFISGNGSLITGGLTNHGAMNFAGTANIAGDVANAAGGRIISGGGGATIFYDDVANDGEIRTSTNGFTVFFGDVTGAGSFTGPGAVNFEGDLAPGNSPAAVHFAGDVAFGPDAVLQIELGGAVSGEYDQIEVAGQLTLGGALELSLIDGFTPAAGQSFDILSCGSLAGGFSSITLPTLEGLTWDASQLTAGVLSVAPARDADFDMDGDVDGDDLIQWQGDFGLNGLSDADDDGDSDGADFLTWQRQLGSFASATSARAASVPEPAMSKLLFATTVSLASRAKRQRRSTRRGI